VRGRAGWDVSAAPLTLAELDLLSTLDAARTPGRLCVAVSSRGEFGIFGGADGEAWIATLPRGRGAEAEAFVAMANALPALLAEVRASRERERICETWQAVEPDTAPRLHIPADLLTRPAGGGLR
jgi:hypothetical protein